MTRVSFRAGQSSARIPFVGKGALTEDEVESERIMVAAGTMSEELKFVEVGDIGEVDGFVNIDEEMAVLEKIDPEDDEEVVDGIWTVEKTVLL